MGNKSEQDLLQAADSLRQLLADARIPEEVRADLRSDFEQIEAMIGKLNRGDLHIAVVGKVSVGKSSLLNALIGRDEFLVSPLHGATRRSAIAHWEDRECGGVHLIDTPGINELDGEAREKMALEIAQRSDLILFVVEGDLTASEASALKTIAAQRTPVILVLNKADRYTSDELALLLEALQRHVAEFVTPDNVIAAAADPRPQKVVRVDESGRETESERPREPRLEDLRKRIWEIMEAEGKTLSALNAALFAGRLSDEVARRIADVRRELAEKVVRTYSLTKGVTVALNPIPVADLLAAAAVDVALVKHLSQVYGLPMTRRESGRLIATIVAQLAALMGAVWGVHLVSSALKGVSAGLSIAVTAGAQGALAYYATYLVGRAAEAYLVRGKSWGEAGPKRVVRQILDRLDRNSILADARAEILERIKER
ncbi:MAG: GTP-binding protein [Xanthomonadales bacterium]|nr:GTP-binding protein [Xanthomonadales bacterium]